MAVHLLKPLIGILCFFGFVYEGSCAVGVLNAALNKPTNQSSTNYSGHSHKAVDGNEGGDWYSGNCTLTEGTDHTWWAVDLEHIFKVINITITNRQDCCGTRLRNFTIMGSNESYFLEPGAKLQECYYQHEPLNDKKTFTCNPPIFKNRYIIINKLWTVDDESDKALTLCEVEVLAECLDGNYGENCQNNCSTNCFSDQPCDKETGFCQACKAGYEGDMCEDGNYDESCQNCLSANLCDTETGFCQQCKAGYEGDRCDGECANGTYGYNCAQNCSLTCQNSQCDSVNGSCGSDCVEGFKGEYCTCDSDLKASDEDHRLRKTIAATALLIIAVMIFFLGFCIGRTSRPKVAKDKEEPGTGNNSMEELHVDNLSLNSQAQDDVNQIYEQILEPNVLPMTEGTARPGNITAQLSQHSNGYTKLITGQDCSSDTLVKVPEFHAYFISKMQHRDPFKEEYEVLNPSIKPNIIHEMVELGKLRFNEHGRHKDITTADNVQVKLISTAKSVKSNTVKIEGYKKQLYIATLSPLPNTAAAFWSMIYEHKCSSVVCLQTDPNYTQWFSSSTNSSVVFDEFTVMTVGEEVNDVMSCHDITMTQATSHDYENVHGLNNDCQNPLKLQVYILKGWSPSLTMDGNISGMATSLDHLLNKQRIGPGPITVLCNDGITDCGMYIAANWLLEMAKKEEHIDVFNVVKQIRETGPKFISTKEQYILLHRIIQECLPECGKNVMKSKK